MIYFNLGLIDYNKVKGLDLSKIVISKQIKVDNVTNKNKNTSNTPTENKFLNEKHSPQNPNTPTNTTDWKPIAMKIVKIKKFKTIYFKKECKIFTKLLADKNQTVEKYGIPAVWYKGNLLNQFHAIAMTLCSVSLASLEDERIKLHGQFGPIDTMIVFYQVVRLALI